MTNAISGIVLSWQTGVSTFASHCQDKSRHGCARLLDNCRMRLNASQLSKMTGMRRYVSGDPAIAFDYDAGTFAEVESVAA